MFQSRQESDRMKGLKSSGGILFLGSTNICRSVMLEAVFKKLLMQKLGENTSIKVSSAGLDAFDYSPPVENVRKALLEIGINVDNHTSKPLTDTMIEENTLILTTTSDVKKRLIVRYPESKKKTYTLAEYVNSKKDMNDPMGRPLEKYRECRTLMEPLLEKLYMKEIHLPFQKNLENKLP